MCSGVSGYFVYWVHSYLVCSCYSQSGVCLETCLLDMVHACCCSCFVVAIVYSMLYVVGNEQARCTLLYYVNVYALYRKAVQLCHACATAHSMNLQYVQKTFTNLVVLCTLYYSYNLVCYHLICLLIVIQCSG